MTYPVLQRSLLAGLLCLSPVLAQAETATTSSPPATTTVTPGKAYCLGYVDAARIGEQAFDAWRGMLGLTRSPLQTYPAATTNTVSSETSSTGTSTTETETQPTTVETATAAVRAGSSVETIILALVKDVEVYVVLPATPPILSYVAALGGFVTCPDGTVYPWSPVVSQSH